MPTLSTAEARVSLSKLIDSAVRTHERFDVTHNGSRAVVILSADDYDAMVETIEVLSEPEAVRALQVSLRELDAGEFVSAETMRDRRRAAGRLED